MQTQPNYIKRAYDFVFDKELSIYSAALSFNVIFALIPFLMLGFYAASFFPAFAEYYEKFREFLFSNIAAIEPSVIEQYLNVFTSNYEKIGLIGLFTALYANFIFLSMFDTVAQKIFGCESRGMLASAAIYTVVFLALVFCISIPIVLLVLIHYFDGSILFDIFPMQLFLSAFIIFKYIPHRHIDAKNAIISAIVATVLIELLRSVFVYYVVYSKAYLTIYGSFATLFLFFAWVNVSAHLFLLCMKFCANLQNNTTSQTPKQTRKK